MTLSEFTAWLDGYDESIDGAPTKEQWEKIRLKWLDVVMDPYPVYTPVYTTPNFPNYPFGPIWSSTTCGSGTATHTRWRLNEQAGQG